ncbi:MAG: hypothetical protein QM724_01790 [Flavobacteriales bacterium]
MLKWFTIGFVLLCALMVLGYLRTTYLPVKRLTAFLHGQGIQFIRIRRGSSAYGWPSYVIVFDSIEKSIEFRHSAAFDAFTKEVGKMHNKLAGFESDRAVSVEPVAHHTA